MGQSLDSFRLAEHACESTLKVTLLYHWEGILPLNFDMPFAEAALSCCLTITSSALTEESVGIRISADLDGCSLELPSGSSFNSSSRTMIDFSVQPSFAKDFAFLNLIFLFSGLFLRTYGRRDGSIRPKRVVGTPPTSSADSTALCQFPLAIWQAETVR
jgi:hypothetical protein